jgi:hypothetical protein
MLIASHEENEMKSYGIKKAPAESAKFGPKPETHLILAEIQKGVS